MNDKDLRVQKTKKSIKDTIKNMICTMEYHKITVMELAKRANIHRKTFYLHYETIDALYDELIQEIAEGYFKLMENLEVPVNMKKQTQIFYEYYCYQEEYVERLLCNESYKILCDKMFSYEIQHNTLRDHRFSYLSIEKQNIITTFLVSSTVEIYRRWVKDGKKLSIDELVNLSCNLICFGYNDLVN